MVAAGLRSCSGALPQRVAGTLLCMEKNKKCGRHCQGDIHSRKGQKGAAMVRAPEKSTPPFRTWSAPPGGAC